MKTISKLIFIQDFSKENKQLTGLEKLYVKALNSEKKELVERDAMFLKQGLAVEKMCFMS